MIDTTTFAALRFASVSFDCPPAIDRQQLRDGTVIDTSVGADLWQAEVALHARPHGAQAEAETLLRHASRVGRFVLAYDPRRCGPAADPGGVILDGQAPTISVLDANNTQIRLTNMRPNYTLTVGDYIGWIYAGRYALHRIVTTVTASGAGVSPLFTVDPHIRPGATVGTPVTLVRPVAKFRVTELTPGRGAGRVTSGPTFAMIQTLGA